MLKAKQAEELRKKNMNAAQEKEGVDDNESKFFRLPGWINRDKNATSPESENDNKSTDTPFGLSSLWTTVGSSISSIRNSEGNAEEWVVACPKTRISPGEMVPVVAGGIDLLLIASRDGKGVRCVANSCPHLGTPLDTGQLIMLEGAAVATGTAPPPQASPGGAPSNAPAPVSRTSPACGECIVCPLHRTVFSVSTGEVQGEWCPYPPVLGNLMGTVKGKTNLATFAVRTRGKNIEVRLNSALLLEDG